MYKLIDVILQFLLAPISKVFYPTFLLAKELYGTLFLPFDAPLAIDHYGHTDGGTCRQLPSCAMIKVHYPIPPAPLGSYLDSRLKSFSARLRQFFRRVAKLITKKLRE